MESGIAAPASTVEDIRNTRRIRMVIHRGRIVDSIALLQMAREQQERFP